MLASIVVAGSLFGALGCGSSFATNDDDTASGGSSTGGAATGGAATGGAATGGSSTGGTASGGASPGGSTGTGGQRLRRVYGHEPV